MRRKQLSKGEVGGCESDRTVVSDCRQKRKSPDILVLKAYVVAGKAPTMILRVEMERIRQSRKYEGIVNPAQSDGQTQTDSVVADVEQVVHTYTLI